MSKTGKRRHTIADILRELLSYNGKLKLPMAVALLFAAAGAVLTIIGPNMLSDITNLITESLFTGIDMAAIGGICVNLLTIYLISAILTYVEHFIMATVTLELSRDLRRDLSRKINVVPMSYFNKASYGGILSRVTNDVSTLQQALSNSLPSIISSAAQFAGCLIMMFVTEWRMALSAVLVTVAGFLIMGIAMLRSQKYFTSRQRNLSKLNGYVEEMYSGHDVVRISRANDGIKRKFGEMNDELYDSDWRSQFLSGIMQPLMTVIGNLGYVAVCVVGAALAMDGQIEFGVIVAFIMYVRLFTSPLSTLAQGMTQMQTAAAAGGHIFDFLHAEEMPEEPGKLSAPEQVRGEVDFEHVRFSYPDDPEKIIIKDFSAHVEPGQKVAIVGPTGAGKTTLVNLLMRFYEINGGCLKIDGHPIDTVTRDSLRANLGMVLQETWLKSGTIAENIAYGKPNATREEIIDAAKKARAHSFICRLPQGYDTAVAEDGGNISQGQRQLLCIARVMLRRPPILILDEATSSIDTRTEVLVQDAFEELMKGRTSFIVAHRLSTIKNADQILVMKDGNIIERGTHETLLARGGFYKQLYESQFAKA